MPTILELQKEIYKTATEKGWWEPGKHKTIIECIALMHCELSEAIEEVRISSPYYYEKEGKPEGLAVELADCLIRILDTAEHLGINMEEVMLKKMEYNKTRSYKHGNKTC